MRLLNIGLYRSRKMFSICMFSFVALYIWKRSNAFI
jgi:hypothetical protein